MLSTESCSWHHERECNRYPGGMFGVRGVPKQIRSDNGPEFVSKAIQRWLKRVEVETLYVEPGSPWENGYAESFHGRFRDEFLSLELFESLSAAKLLTDQWKEDYNHYRPHSSLGYLPPATFAARCAASVPASATPQPPLRQHNDSLTPTFITPGTEF